MSPGGKRCASLAQGADTSGPVGGGKAATQINTLAQQAGSVWKVPAGQRGRAPWRCHLGLCCETLGEWVRTGFDTRPQAYGRCEPSTQTRTPSSTSQVSRGGPLVNGPGGRYGASFL